MKSIEEEIQPSDDCMDTYKNFENSFSEPSNYRFWYVLDEKIIGS